MLERQDLAAASILALRAMRQPVIAAVNGAAVGGGLSIALAADVRLAGRKRPGSDWSTGWWRRTSCWRRRPRWRGQAFATRDAGFPEALAAVRAQFARAAPHP